MAEYKTLKIPVKIWDIFDAYVKTHTTVNDSATSMIQDLIKTNAKVLLQEMIKQMEEKKANWETVRDQLDSIS
ncbi:hypothetical protein [Candidatus Lokiarchaeum ossiferum]|uniref:hypothetical protein n=1 Tax=Candidatus Lokiarchaeum ossiferum TaxID=2951803 RepID=UPI00352D59F2